MFIKEINKVAGECTHNCKTCGSDCAKKEKTDFMESPHAMSSIKNVIGVVSGKGGVGKSLVTSLLAVTMQRRGFKTAVLDADITGPSIPRIFGIKERAKGDDTGLFPVETKTGIKIMSLNLLVDDPTSPVIWRGPVIAGAVKQFWTDVIWGDIDYMFIDMPPGTGDVPLTVFQSIPVDGAVVVTSPQDLVTMIVGKAVNMAKKMSIPIKAVVENYSYLICPDCGKKINIYGESKLPEVVSQYGVENTARIPVDPAVAKLCDDGLIELFVGDWLDKLADSLQ